MEEASLAEFPGKERLSWEQQMSAHYWLQREPEGAGVFVWMLQRELTESEVSAWGVGEQWNFNIRTEGEVWRPPSAPWQAQGNDPENTGASKPPNTFNQEEKAHMIKMCLFLPHSLEVASLTESELACWIDWLIREILGSSWHCPQPWVTGTGHHAGFYVGSRDSNWGLIFRQQVVLPTSPQPPKEEVFIHCRCDS